jgi:carbohydrate-selective porin OprB
MRANTASQSLFNIKASYLAGLVNNNPLGRDTRDQIGLALAINRVNAKVFTPSSTKPYEELAELYWAWTFFHWFQITPDVQLYVNPALNKRQQLATIYTLRSNIIF